MPKRKPGRKRLQTKKPKRLELHFTVKQEAYVQDIIGLETYGSDRASVFYFLFEREINALIAAGRIAQRQDAVPGLTESRKG